ncbi:NADPH azoreductase [Pigmentiphaga humi]|uniref:NADPH azoreductase n=1 Tax=Pigmentiphaga humi TaxID=2478468 RepID=A0A3P4B0L6_9BURK|nr:NAD(P)H-dependent oxidoreductase [Pigmentiphaga humi]VCU69280.1 NADPH azoreductase [Pigmentiphaga humi]
MDYQPLIVGLGGTTRAGSSSEKALALSLRAAEREGARVAMLAGPELEMPMYAPERPERSGAAQRLTALLRRCDGLIIASPSYHGTISGLLKNALDYTEDLSRDERVYFDGCAIGLIACGAGWQGAGHALTALRAIAHSLRGWPTPLGAVLNTSIPLFDETGACRDAAAAFQLECVGRQVVQFARMKAALERVSSLAEA